MSARALIITATTLAATTACAGRPLFERERPAVERTSNTIPPGRFHVIAGVAGGSSRTDLQISATVRQRMQDSGFTMVRKAGRWENITEAVRSICQPGQAQSVDGVLFIWYNRLELRDCVTEGAAFEIGGTGASIGITAMVDRLVRWLKKESEAAPASTP